MINSIQGTMGQWGLAKALKLAKDLRSAHKKNPDKVNRIVQVLLSTVTSRSLPIVKEIVAQSSCLFSPENLVRDTGKVFFNTLKLFQSMRVESDNDQEDQLMLALIQNGAWIDQPNWEIITENYPKSFLYLSQRQLPQGVSSEDAIVCSAQNGHTATLKLLLMSQPSLRNYQDENELTIGHIALTSGFPDTALAWMEIKGTNVSAVDSEDNTLLHTALKMKASDAAFSICKKHPAFVSCMNQDGKYPIDIYTEKKLSNPPLLRLLLNSETFSTVEKLEHVARAGDLTVFQEIWASATKEEKIEACKNGSLIVDTCNQNEEIALFLLSKIDLNALPLIKFLPAYSQAGFARALEYVLKENENARAFLSKENPPYSLINGLFNKDISTAEVLVKYGARFPDGSGPKKKNPLHWIFSEHSGKDATPLLEWIKDKIPSDQLRAWILEKNYREMTPLHLVASQYDWASFTRMVDILGSDAQIPGIEQFLSFALSDGQIALVHQLLQRPEAEEAIPKIKLYKFPREKMHDPEAAALFKRLVDEKMPLNFFYHSEQVNPQSMLNFEFRFFDIATQVDWSVWDPQILRTYFSNMGNKFEGNFGPHLLKKPLFMKIFCEEFSHFKNLFLEKYPDYSFWDGWDITNQVAFAALVYNGKNSDLLETFENRLLSYHETMLPPQLFAELFHQIESKETRENLARRIWDAGIGIIPRYDLSYFLTVEGVSSLKPEQVSTLTLKGSKARLLREMKIPHLFITRMKDFSPLIAQNLVEDGQQCTLQLESEEDHIFFLNWSAGKTPTINHDSFKALCDMANRYESEPLRKLLEDWLNQHEECEHWRGKIRPAKRSKSE